MKGGTFQLGQIPTNPTRAPLSGKDSVLRRVFVAVFAVGLLSVMFTSVASTNIFFTSHRFQVIWIDATSNTAKMVKLKAGRDFATVKLVRESVGLVEFSVNANLSISRSSQCSHPNPATRFGNLHHFTQNTLPRCHLYIIAQQGAV